MTCRIDIEGINDFVEQQLAVWTDAKNNYDALSRINRKAVKCGDFEMYAQNNPARIRSTAAKTDAASISTRPCFLCASNRPDAQMAYDWIDGWQLLLNPFPILPIHFTIVDKYHRPQDRIPLDMATMAENAPDLAIFFNGACAGASAPDHRHCQAVLKSELPLIRLIEKEHTDTLPDVVSSECFGLDLPFQFVSAVIRPDNSGLWNLKKMTEIKGVDAVSGKPDAGLVNAFFWIDGNGMLRIAVIPRRAHRPKIFYATDDSRITLSPGALDMAGLLILPIPEDYQRITPGIVRQALDDVAFSKSLPPEILSHF